MADDKFEYSYSAPTEKERKEIESILREYSPEKTANADKLARLRSLDKKVKLLPNIIAWVLGIIGILTFGGGLSLVLEFAQVLWGALLSAVGIALCLISYPIYKRLYTRGKAKYGEEILSLSKELLSTENNKTAL